MQKTPKAKLRAGPLAPVHLFKAQGGALIRYRQEAFRGSLVSKGKFVGFAAVAAEGVHTQHGWGQQEPQPGGSADVRQQAAEVANKLANNANATTMTGMAKQIVLALLAYGS
jgi:hypothetical protein